MLKIGNIRCDDLIRACGSPLYVYDENKIEKQLQDYQTYFKSDMFETEVIYASKAFTCSAMLHKLECFQTSLDVVSGGELYAAKRVNFNPEKIYFHGNNKTEEELKMAFEYGVKTIVIDNMYEIDHVVLLAKEMKKTAHILIRVNPKVEAHTHEFIMTATSDSKFGISIDLFSEIKEMIEKIIQCEYLVFDGFHCHIGSQIFDHHAFIGSIEKMVEFVSLINSGVGIEVPVLNIGGGFGVKYTSEDTPLGIETMSKALISALEEQIKKYAIRIDKVCIEPGRSIVGEAGYTLYEVGFTKKTQNKEFVFINGGMSDNIRPALYDAVYACDIANKMELEKTHTYDVAGKCCESGDILIHDALLPKAEAKDIMVVYTTGAYGYSMASNYNRMNRPAVVFVKDRKARIVIQRETYEDVNQLDYESKVNI